MGYRSAARGRNLSSRDKGLPKLENLEIKNVREQTYLWQSEIRLLQDISSLNRLQISGCPQLLSLVAEKEHDQQQQEMPCRLQYLELRDCEGLTKLPQALLTLSSLTEMRIYGCASLVSFPQAPLPSQLRTIGIERCSAMKSLPEAWMHNSNSSLHSLEIRDCNSLVSFPEVALPSQLRTVKINKCNALESLPEAWMQNSNTSLESLEIRSCDSLKYIARIQLTPSLKRLIIGRCANLRTLTREQDIRSSSSGCTSLTSFSSENELPATLEHLDVGYCSNLAFLSRNGKLPQALKYLRVEQCSRLESLAERLDNTSLEEIFVAGNNLKSLPVGLHNLQHLEKITIWACPNLESFPEEGLPSTKLTELYIWECDKLKALPSCMHNLTSLLQLAICKCPSLVSFPADGFPTNLQSLTVEDLKISMPLFEWGLTSLKRLIIGGECPDLVSSPRFPVSLTELSISDMPNLEHLPSIGESLTSLEILDLENCPKLKYFPKRGLPKSLLKLIITDCPLIEKRCNGKYWPMITHIPHVEIDTSTHTCSSSDSS